MGREMDSEVEAASLENRPGILVVGAPNVGKRTILSSLSVDGDSQGVERLFGALAAHMWPGMVLKSGNNMIAESYQPEKEEFSEEDSDYELEYEMLSGGSAEPWDDTEEWVSADGAATTSSNDRGSVTMNADRREHEIDSNESPSTSEAPVPEHNTNGNLHNVQPSTSEVTVSEKADAEVLAKENKQDTLTELNGDTGFGFEDLEHLMNEIGNVRDNLRLMPDFQRRETAAKVAMKMATMFGDSSADEADFD